MVLVDVVGGPLGAQYLVDKSVVKALQVGVPESLAMYVLARPWIPSERNQVLDKGAGANPTSVYGGCGL